MRKLEVKIGLQVSQKTSYLLSDSSYHRQSFHFKKDEAELTVFPSSKVFFFPLKSQSNPFLSISTLRKNERKKFKLLKLLINRIGKSLKAHFKLLPLALSFAFSEIRKIGKK